MTNFGSIAEAYNHPEPVKSLYLAHAISGPIDQGVHDWIKHRAEVEMLGIEIARLGFIPIVPILLGDIGWEDALRMDYTLVSLVDGIFLHISEWESKGAELECKWASELGKPVFYNLDDLKATWC